MKWIATCVVCVSLFVRCAEVNETQDNLEVVFHLNDSTRVSFPLQQQNDLFTLQNGGEEMELLRTNDSTFLVPVFGGSWVLDSTERRGVWTDSLRSSNYHVDFDIQPRSSVINTGVAPEGTWDVWFGDSDTSAFADAQLDLQCVAGSMTGTMRTPTGDYRFFSGVYRSGLLHMQTYDGAHLYCFKARYTQGSWIDGSFYSGNHYHTQWSGRSGRVWPNGDTVKEIQVQDSDLLITTLDRNGSSVEVSLVPQPGEVVVVDILGTWCPNCMDEVRLLREVQENHPGIRVISMAYERDTTALDVYRRLDFYRSQLGINWEVYWGGAASKTIAARTFPFLDQVLSFPTTLFIHPNGRVAIHSGFNGPATGAAYEAEKNKFNQLLSAAPGF